MQPASRACKENFIQNCCHAGSGPAGAAIFVGNLPNDIREREVEDLFIKYGRVRSIDLKTPPRPPAFAFVEFDDPRDAQDAVRGRDGYDFFGNRIRVELSQKSRDPMRGGGGPPPPPQTFRGRGTGFRALVKGLPISCSWQDLKDHFRQVVKPSYTNVFRERNGVLGVVEFDTREDLDRAIRKLDDTKFENPFDSAYVRVIDDSEDGGGRRRSRSRSRGRSVSRGRSAVLLTKRITSLAQQEPQQERE
eukprot:jgi/Astpho2/9279/Aster-06853